MTTHKVNDTAVVRNGEFLTIVSTPTEEVARKLREELARVNETLTGVASPGVRQLLSDIHEALQEAFRSDPRGNDGRRI